MNTFTKVTCNSSRKTCVEPFCYITTNNQSLTYLNFGCNYNRFISNANVRKITISCQYYHSSILSLQLTLKVFYKYQNGYRQIVKGPPINWMYIVRGKNLNPFFKIIVSLLKKTSPSLFLMASPHVSILIALILNLLTFLIPE